MRTSVCPIYRYMCRSQLCKQMFAERPMRVVRQKTVRTVSCTLSGHVLCLCELRGYCREELLVFILQRRPPLERHCVHLCRSERIWALVPHRTLTLYYLYPTCAKSHRLCWTLYPIPYKVQIIHYLVLSQVPVCWVWLVSALGVGSRAHLQAVMLYKLDKIVAQGKKSRVKIINQKGTKVRNVSCLVTLLWRDMHTVTITTLRSLQTIPNFCHIKCMCSVC